MTNKKELENLHKPVLLHEILEVLRVDKLAHLHSNAQLIDATLGYGGHSIEFIKRGVFVLGIETDQEAIKYAKKKLSLACPTPQATERCYKIVHDNFRNINSIVETFKLDSVYGVLMDLGVSSPQITSETRGFSFQEPNADLDMRMDTVNQLVTAADLLNSLPESQLFELFRPYLDYKNAKQIAKKIAVQRKEKKFVKVGDLISAISSLRIEKQTTNNATLPFMALRIAVNTELQNLEEALPNAFDVIKPGGRIAIISFHSEEDKIVKNFFREQVQSGQAIYPSKKLITPGDKEINHNMRARSAKLRVIEKL